PGPANHRALRSFPTRRSSDLVVVVLCGAVTYFVFNLANDDFDTYHRTIGQHVAALRSDDPERQRAAVAQLSIRREAHVLPALVRSEEHTSELQSRENLVCRLL